MKHAGEVALDALENLLVEIRKYPGLKEKKRGTFYQKSAGFIHFHDDPAGFFADLKIEGVFQRFNVTTAEGQAVFLGALAKVAGNGKI